MTAPTVADLSSAIHGLAGPSSAVDSLMTFLAQDLLCAAVLVLAVQWFRRDGLRGRTPRAPLPGGDRRA